jgi:hypothetical protein
MREEIHYGINAVLRTIMADVIGRSPGGWGVFGCYLEGARASWVSLDGLNDTLHSGLRLVARDGMIEPAVMDYAIGILGDEVPADAFGVRLDNLRGIALIGNLQEESGARVLAAQAVFDDGYDHTVNWWAASVAPTWTVRSPAERDRKDASEPTHLRALLAALQAVADTSAPAVSEEQRQLNTELRAILADRVSDGLAAVFIILTDADGWMVIPPEDLAERMAAKTSTGASVREALEALAAELETEGLPAIPVCKGVGTVTHIETERGSTVASLGAYCDGTWHSIMWAHDEVAPDWKITPAVAADSDLAAIIAVYARLTAAISGRRD